MSYVYHFNYSISFRHSIIHYTGNLPRVIKLVSGRTEIQILGNLTQNPLLFQLGHTTPPAAPLGDQDVLTENIPGEGNWWKWTKNWSTGEELAEERTEN